MFDRAFDGMDRFIVRIFDWGEQSPARLGMAFVALWLLGAIPCIAVILAAALLTG